MKIRFQDGIRGGYLGFSIILIVTVFDQKVTPTRNVNFQVNSVDISVNTKYFNLDFQDARYGINLEFPVGTILAIFDLQVTPILPNRFQSGEEAQNSFSMWRPWRPPCISDKEDFCNF